MMTCGIDGFEKRLTGHSFPVSLMMFQFSIAQARTVTSVFVFRRMVCLHESSRAGLRSITEKSENSDDPATDSPVLN